MKTKIFTSLILGFLFLSAQTSQAQNVLIDGSFDTTTSIFPYCCEAPPLNTWNSFKNLGTEANATVVGGVCVYQVINAGTTPAEIQLEQIGFPLIPGHAYNLSFRVMADADRTFGVFLGEYWGNWTDLLRYDRYIQNATTSWQTLSFDFNADCVFPLHKISFELGGINTSMYFDDIILTDLGPATTFSIGIVGTSLSGGWDTDVDMLTTDGINYTLSNYPLMPGYVKFRQDHNWCINWGSLDFPSGIGIQDGWNIPVPKFCNYDITFNRLTGEYSFVNVGSCAPEIGIIGSAVPPNFEAEPDVNMLTRDRKIYTLKHYLFTDGVARFRQDDNNVLKWADNTFPTGAAIQDGPDIPVTAGVYDVTFNVETGEYSFTYPVVGIIGDALLGWDTDVDMQTTSGSLYTLTEYTFTNGYAKFRTDHSWDENFGDETFPSGWLYFNGPNIPVPAGTYNVTFDMMTGRYNFVATNCPVPGIRCPDNIYTVNTPGVCGAYVNYPEVIAEYNCGGAGLTIVQTAGLVSDELFPIGTTTNTFILTNESGAIATCSFDVVVNDSEPPIITDVDTHTKSTWPPNHKMICLTIDYTSKDNCGVTGCGLVVSSNEPNYGHGNCVKGSDWVILDDHHVLLNAEREGQGKGRIYTITITCADAAFNTSSQQVIVKTPHNNKGGHNDRNDYANHDCSIEIVNSTHYGSSCIKTLNVGEILESKQFSVNAWPNPSTQNFNLQVESASSEIINLIVSDITGRQVLKLNASKDLPLNFGDELQPGVYFIKVMQGDNSEIIKVVKQ